MANLPEKNVVLVDKITNVPTDSNLFINANGEFKQASVNDVVNSSTVVSTAVETAINTAVQDSIDSNFKQTSGSPILLTDSADGTLIGFKGKGRSTQNGTPTPDSPIEIKSVADSGYFDGELVTGYYNADGTVNGTAQYVSAKNLMPCNVGDVIKFTYAETVTKLVILFFDDTKYLSQVGADNSATVNATAPSGATRFGITIHSLNGITPQTAKPITVTINGKYALIVKCIGKNLLNINEIDKDTRFFSYTKYTNDIVKATANVTTRGSFICSFSAYLEKGKRYIFSQESTNLNSAYIYSDRLWGNNIGVVDVVTAPNYTHKADSGIYIIGYYGAITSGTEYSVVKPMLRRAEVTDGTYEPYKEEVKYIPLNEPLRSLGNVKDEVNLDEGNITRRFKEVIFDGSDELWSDDGQQASGLYRYNIGVADLKKQRMGAICTHFTPSNAYQFSEIKEVCFSTHPTSPELAFFTEYATLTEFKTWLQANPITVIYELAEPITESIEPVDIVTYDNVTYLTASDNAEMELEYPTSKVAGIASIGYSKGRKAEYEVELLKAQLLELQTAMVNSL